jgi:hypothetical protein
LLLVSAGSAVAATGGKDPATPEQTGYRLTNGQFRYAHEQVYLRNASQYSGSIAGLGQSIQFWGNNRVFVLGVSNSASTGPWSPAVAIYNQTTHALICSTAGATPCPGTPQSWLSGLSYPVGTTVVISTFYDTLQGTLGFTVRNVGTGNATTFTWDAGTGISFGQVRMGTEFGNDPWTPPSFTAPASQLKTAAFTNAGVTNYKGNKHSLVSYFTTARLTMTGAGSVLEADASNITQGGTAFNTFLVP